MIEYFDLYGDKKNGCRIKVHKSLYTPYLIKEMIKNAYSLRNDSKENILRRISKHHIPIFNIIAVYSIVFEENGVDTLVSSIIKAYRYGNSRLCQTMSILDIETDDSNRINIYFQDDYKNIYRLILVDRDSYINYNYGSLANTNFVRQALRNRSSIPNAKDVVNSNMKIYKMDGINSVIMPKGSTALDFAFDLHEEIGLCAYGAIINGDKSGLDRKLEDSDVVEILTDTARDKETGELMRFEPNAKFDWFLITSSEKAKETLVDYFKQKQFD